MNWEFISIFTLLVVILRCCYIFKKTFENIFLKKNIKNIDLYNHAKKKRLQIIFPIEYLFIDSYSISAGSYNTYNKICAGYSVNILGNVNNYYEDNGTSLSTNIVNKLHIDLTISPTPENNYSDIPDYEVVGWGKFESLNRLEINIEIASWCIKDIVQELQKELIRTIRVDGIELDDGRIAIMYFHISPYDTK